MPRISGNRYLAIEGSAQSAEEAIRLCGDALVRAGCVREGFAQGCIDREKDYPTGICSEAPVALPHCMSDEIINSALCYLRLDEPVEFKRMDDYQETVKTRHVFNLAIDRGDHLKFLSRVISLLQDSAVVSRLENTDISEVALLLQGLIECEV